MVIDAQQVQQVENFKYLESVIEANGSLNGEINNRTSSKTEKLFNAFKNTFLRQRYPKREWR